MEQLDRLLEDIEENIDFEQCFEIDQRYAKALNYEVVDRPPLTIECKQYSLARGPISYQEAFEDPAKMMYNELLVRVKFCMDVGDDGSKALRSDHGTVVVSSMLGGKWKIRTDMWPWIEPFKGLDKIREIVEKGVPETSTGLASKVYEFLQFYGGKLKEYPKCKQAIQISMPDPQGPFDVAELLCGCDMFLHLYDEPKLIGELLGVVAKTIVPPPSSAKSITLFFELPGDRFTKYLHRRALDNGTPATTRLDQSLLTENTKRLAKSAQTNIELLAELRMSR